MFKHFGATLVAACAFMCPIQAQETEPSKTEEEKTKKEKTFEGKDVKVTTPTGSPANNLDTPESVTSVDKRKIEERGFGQMPDILEGTPGIFVQHTAGGQASPFIRGLTGKQITMVVNGVRFNNSAFRSGPNQYYSSLDAANIARIEVLRGPGSVLYGSDAQGGVLQVFTHQPSFEDFDYTFGVRPRFSSANMEKRGNIFGEVGGHNFGFIGSATYSDAEHLVGGSGIGRMPHTEYEEWGVYSSFGVRFGKHTVSFTYSHFQQVNVDRTDAVSTLVANPSLLPGGGTLSRELENRFPVQGDDIAVLNWQWRLDQLLESITVNAMYHKVQEDLIRTTRSATASRRNQGFNVHTLGLNALAVLNFGELSRVTLGAELYHDIIHARRSDQRLSTGRVTVLDDNGQFPDWSQYTQAAVYAQDEIWLWNNKFLIRPGVRYSAFRAQADLDTGTPALDGVNEFFDDITGALAFLIRPIDQLSFSLNMARGFRAPNLDDLAASKGTGAGNEIPNPNLEPEDQWAVEVGVKGLLPMPDKTNAAPYWISGSVAFYFNYFDNAFRRINTTFGANNVVQFDNSGRYRIFGVEAEFSWFIGPELKLFGLNRNYVFFEGDALGFIANFAWAHGDDIKNDEPVGRISPAMSEIAIRYSAMNNKIYIEPFVQIVGRQDQIASGNKTDVRFTPHDEPGYVLFGLRTGWYPVRNFRLNLNITNIGNRAYHGLGNGTFGPGTNVILSAELKW